MCSWLVEIDPASIDDVSGKVYGRYLIEVATKTKEAVERILAAR